MEQTRTTTREAEALDPAVLVTPEPVSPHVWDVEVQLGGGVVWLMCEVTKQSWEHGYLGRVDFGVLSAIEVDAATGADIPITLTETVLDAARSVVEAALRDAVEGAEVLW